MVYFLIVDSYKSNYLFYHAGSDPVFSHFIGFWIMIKNRKIMINCLRRK